jgi:hypothetical protein
MSLVGFLLIHILAISLLALTAFVLGRRVLGSFPFTSLLEEIACSTTLGLGLLSLVIFTVGIAGWLNRPVVVVLLFGIWMLSFPVWRGWPTRAAHRLRGMERPSGRRLVYWILGSALVIALTSPIWLLSYYPPSGWDDISYHLASAKGYIEHGRIVVTPYLRFATFPQAVNMLFVLALLLADDITAQLVSFLMFLLVALFLFVWGRRDGSATAGVIAAALWLGSPMVILIGSTAYIDVGLALFVVGGAYGLFRWIESQRPSWLLLAAFLTGMSAGCKYSGLFFIFFFGLAILAIARSRERWGSFFSFGAVATAAALPWYVRNYVATGDPLFPMLLPFVGYGFWSGEDLAIQASELASHGIGRGFAELATIWWHIGWNQGFFHSQSLSSLALVIPIPLLLLFRWRSPRARILLSLTMLFVVIWFQTGQVLRYLLPVLPFLCLEMATLIDAILRRVIPDTRERVRQLATATVAAAILYQGVTFGMGEITRWGAVPTDAQTRDTFLSTWLPDYPAYKLLNEKYGSDYTLYALRGELMTYYADGRYRGDAFGPARASRIMVHLDDGQALYDELREMEADHFLVSTHADSVALPDDEVFRRRFRLLYEKDGVRLYQMAEPTD